MDWVSCPCTVVSQFHPLTYRVLSLVSIPVTMSGRSCFQPATLWSRFLLTMPTQLQLQTLRMEQILGWRGKRGRMDFDFGLAKKVFRHYLFKLLFPWLCFTLKWPVWSLRRSVSKDVWDIRRLLLWECWTSSAELSSTQQLADLWAILWEHPKWEFFWPRPSRYCYTVNR
jgi:hypothetical protein